MDFLNILALLLTCLLFVVGLIGTVVPVMPGVILIYSGLMIYGLFTGFSELSVSFFIVQGLATILVLGVDYLATALGAKKFGASTYAIWGAVIGLLTGTIVMGLPGVIFGPFIGAFIGELIKGSDLKKSLFTSMGTLIGLLGGIIIKLTIEALMITWFFMSIW